MAFLELYLVTLTTFAPADPGVLERVAQRRAAWGQLPSDWQSYPVLIAGPDCSQVGRAGWIVTEGGTRRALVVDCAKAEHRPGMLAGGGFVDANIGERARGWMVVKD